MTSTRDIAHVGIVNIKFSSHISDNIDKSSTVLLLLFSDASLSVVIFSIILDLSSFKSINVEYLFNPSEEIGT